MRHVIRKSFVLLSLSLYLAATCAASLHAFPMMESNSIQSSTLGDQTDNSINCHAMSAESYDQPDTSLGCEIFCAVMGQIISVETCAGLQAIAQESNINRFIEPHISFHTQVEPKPPKHLS